jgi:hypothetical protein
MAYRVTVRAGSEVERHDTPTLHEALDVVEREARAAAAGPRRKSVDLRMRTFEPVQQVATRVEVRGPGARGGVDVRGDGSVEAFTGRWHRRVVDQQPRETPYAALRRELTSGRTRAGP